MPQVRYPFNGQLNQNTITVALYNMIISQRVFDSDVASTALADRFKVDGTLFGDTKLYHSFDIGCPEVWGNDDEAKDLLKLDRNKSGVTQAITMGEYRIIPITIDNYLSKQAFMKEGAFADYISFLTSSLRKIKKVYDRSIINSKIGTLEGSTQRCNIEVVTPRGNTVEEQNRLEAQYIAQAFEILKAELEDNNRDFNALGFLRSYDAKDFVAVWNVNIRSKLTKVDIPTIFHNEISEGGDIEEYKLPARWFGTLGSIAYGASAGDDITIATVKANDEIRILESGWYNVAPTTGTGITLVNKPDTPVSGTSKTIFLWAGDIVPSAGTVYNDAVRGVTVTTTATTINKNLIYRVDKDIACCIVHKDSLPYMSGFETATEFWNARSLTRNQYLIFGHNILEWIEEFPRIKVKVSLAAENTLIPSKVVITNESDNPVLTQEVTPA